MEFDVTRCNNLNKKSMCFILHMDFLYMVRSI